jgi:predicted O-linked N-acetylglucosamine transferase (SPINDLY family)
MNLQVGSLLDKALEALRAANPDAAEVFLKQALKIQPKNPHVLRLFGVLLSQRENYLEAKKYFMLSIKSLPKNGLAHSNLGNVQQKLNKFEESIKSYDIAIRLIPDDYEVWSNKGNALFALKQYEDAIAHHNKSISLNPNYAQGWSNKGNALFALKQYEDAIAHHNKSISLNPNYAQAWWNKGNVLLELRLYEDAIMHYEQAIKINPNSRWALGRLAHAKMIIADWNGLERIVEWLGDKHNAGNQASDPFRIMSLLDSPELHQIYAQNYISRPSQNKGPQEQFSRKAQKDKIKIGYFSADFRNHPVAYLLAEMLELHNREEFEIYAFAIGPSSLDPIRKRIKSGVDYFLDIENKTSKEIALLSRELKIDIAVDLGGHTMNDNTEIFTRFRAAPIQVNFLGYPGTMGSDYYEYIIADSIVIPQNNQQYFNEKIIYLPNSFLVDDSKRVPSDIAFKRGEFGLPEEKFIFCCFNNSYKFNREFVTSLARIMKEVDESIFWVSENNELFRVNFLDELQKQGICADRIFFAKRIDSMGEHLSRLALADLFLDTNPYGAHTTAIDALKSGLPVLTIMGEAFPSRVAASLLNTLKLPELITYSREEFEALAIKLAVDTGALEKIKAKLRNQYLTSPLFDTSRYTKNLETAYHKIYMAYSSGLKPSNVYIEE